MEESYVEDLADRDGPVHALAFREGAAKRWCGGARRPEMAGSKWALSGCRRAVDQRKAIPVAAFSRAVVGSRGVEEPVHGKRRTTGMRKGMRGSYIGDLASHGGPESCVGVP